MEMEELESFTVSGNDAVIYYPVVVTVSGNDAASAAGLDAPISEAYTLWDKPIVEYSPTEGMLLILVGIAIAMLINKFIGGFKWLR